MKVHLAAKLDIIEHHGYLQKKASTDLAERFLEELEKTLEALMANPGIGQLYQFSSGGRKSETRFRGVNSFPKMLVFYRVEQDLEVLRVLHRSRNISAILENEENDASED